jgi:membrane fusion protein (multidrug efflux system)
VLFRIDPAPYAAAQGQADAAVAAAEARLKQAEREMARIKPLFEAKAASQQEHDAAEANLDGARAELKRAQAALRAANIDLGYTQVTAPIAGVVGRALKMEGALVTPQDGLLTTLAQTDPMHAHFTVAEADQLKRKQELAAGSLRLAPEGYRVQLKLADGSVYPETGKIDFIDYKADAHTGAYAMRAVIPNARHTLTPGQFGRVLLSGLVRPNAIAVPQRAVLDGPQGKFVYLAVPGQDGKGRIAVPAPVVVGEWAKLGQENAWIVRQGLKAGDPVIVEGTARIFFPGQPVMPVTPQAMARQAQGAPGAGKQ